MTAFGEDIIITIDGTPYTTTIDRIEENGGEKQYKTIKMSGNNYKKVFTGRSDYELILNFRIESTTLNTLYENTTPVTIVITIGTEQIITYSNMLPKSLTIAPVVDGLTDGEITYHAPAYNGASYNRVVT